MGLSLKTTWKLDYGWMTSIEGTAFLDRPHMYLWIDILDWVLGLKINSISLRELKRL